MSNLFASFSRSSKSKWMELLQKELKGEPLDALQKFNRIEEISFPAYFHAEDRKTEFSDPGLLPYTRGNRADTNDWEVGTCFRIEGEGTANAAILDSLMKGTTALVLHATSGHPIDFDSLLEGVGLEFIHTTFYAQTETQAKAFIQKTGTFPSAVVLPSSQNWLTIATETATLPVKPFGINAYSVQQAGGTTWQELAIALAEGHDYLVAQLELGLTVDDASANIHFIFGIGSKYFYEIAKFRAFRTAWSRIIAEYGPQHACSHAATVTAQTGFTTISLKDPYTNLLRQTTQAMSAVIGGVNQLVVQPYDWHASQQKSAFTRRMATNISLLLKEESYLDKVIDPSGGSYALDDLTEAIAERAWAEFQQIEEKGGISQTAVRGELSAAIREKAQQRVSLARDKKETLIGINVFPNPEALTNEWNVLPTAWNQLPALNIETELHAL